MTLFGPLEPEPLPEGMTFRPGFLAEEEEAGLMEWIDAQPWSESLSRRVQHYGWLYSFHKVDQGREVDHIRRLGPLPPPLQALASRLAEEGLLSQTPDQALVNDYQPGQGIAAHIDCEPCFGDEVAMISLLSQVPMDFTHPPSGRSLSLDLPRGSLCVISGPSRWEWRHGIAKRLTDPVPGGGRQARRRRVSVTFRLATPPAT